MLRISLALILAASFCNSIWGQIQIFDNFSDGEFTSNPPWQGDSAKFRVSPDHELQLYDTAAGQAYLSTPSSVAEEALWTGSLWLDFNPSGSNFSRFYLISDRAQLSGKVRGYYLRISGSSSDRLSLYRQDGSQHQLLLQTSPDWVDSDPARVHFRIRRQDSGKWTMALDTGQLGSFRLIDSVRDQQHRSSQFAGWYCEYTKTRAQKMYLDSLRIAGRPYIDSIPPRLDSFRLSGVNRVELYFNEALQPSSVQDTNHYQLSPTLGAPVQAALDLSSGRRVELLFADSLVNKQRYELRIQGLRDEAGNSYRDSLSLRRVVAEVGDLLLHELMIDPSPVVGVPPQALPEREYIELYNTSAVTQNLENWRIQIDGDPVTLPEYPLPPDSLVIITDEDGRNEWPPNSPIAWADMGRYALLNDGATLELLSPENRTVDELHYDRSWYDDPSKEDGGWSLEMIDTGDRCGGRANWTFSQDPLGGTPGRTNSVAGTRQDTIPPELSRVSIPENSTLVLHFSEYLPPQNISTVADYRLLPPLPVDSLTASPLQQQVVLHLGSALDPQETYALWMQSLPVDCQGNELQPDTLTVGIPAQPDSGNIWINELLFNPHPGGSDYLELFHGGDRVYDLSRLRVGQGAKGSPADLQQPVRDSYLWYPGEYILFTEDSADLADHYRLENPQQIIEVSDLPSWPDDAGEVGLYNSSLELIDHLAYEDDWHLAVLEEEEGVALERLHGQLPSQEASSWASAAASAGYGTPGYENSQKQSSRFQAQLEAQPQVFSPNQDGYRDRTEIAYRFPRPGYVVNLYVYSPSGQLMKTIAQQKSVGQEGFLVWDGTDASGKLVGRGNYILILEYFHPQGTSGQAKALCAVSR